MTVTAKSIDLLLETRPAAPKGARGPAGPVAATEAGARAEARFAAGYLEWFGYFARELSGWKDISADDVAAALKTFQSWFGLRKSGRLDAPTVRAMLAPRCGVPDIPRAHNRAGVMVAAASDLARWTKRKLTYRVAAYVPGVPKTEQDQVYANAFLAWTRHGNIDVSPAPAGGRADIVIRTGQGAGSQFDGPGGTLAWAYLPDGSDGPLEMRFDLGETWVTSPARRGVLLDAVAKHEFGHLFGLTHSKVQGALMAPYYNPAVRDPQADDDVPRFVARYDVRPGGPAAPPPAGGGDRRVVVEFGGMGVVTVDGNVVP